MLNFRALVAQLDAYLKVIDGEEHSFYATYNKIDMIRNAVCYNDGVAVACGAFKPFDETTVEIKRMYVLPGFRGKGFGHEVLKELEKWAAESGYKHSVLETGKRQAAAIKLYERSGYSPISNYGQYKNVRKQCLFEKGDPGVVHGYY